MDVVELGPSDAAAAVALWEACGLTRPWNDARADFLRAVAGPSSAVLGIRSSQAAAAAAPAAVHQSSLLGTAMVGHDGHRGWVYYLAVTPSAQGSGLGRTLMDACEQWLIARGIPKIQFMVRTDNAAVLSFYDHLGYPQQDVLVLGRRLS